MPPESQIARNAFGQTLVTIQTRGVMLGAWLPLDDRLAAAWLAMARVVVQSVTA